MAPHDTTRLDEKVADALAALDAGPRSPALDALADPEGARGAVPAFARGEAVLRAVRELGPATAAYAPDPLDAMWLRRAGAAGREVRVVSQFGKEAAQRVAVERVRIVRRELPCCDAPGCTASRWLTEAGFDLEDGSWLACAEAIGVDEVDSPAVRAFAVELAAALETPLEATDASSPPPPGPAPASAGASNGLDAHDLSRFSLRAEGDRFVLRDWASAGPRASAKPSLVVSGAAFVATAALWAQTARAIALGAHGQAVAFGAVAVLTSILTYAFLGVARFSAKYVARSVPLVAIGRGKIVVGPWVSRAGAVDLRPEGRLGAAISLAEVEGLSVEARDGGYLPTMRSDHGPIDVMPPVSEAMATFWGAALERAIAAARHASAGPSALQRARSRPA